MPSEVQSDWYENNKNALAYIRNKPDVVEEKDVFTTSRNGTVPKPTAQEVSANKYLRADGTWKNPPGGGGGGSTVTITPTLSSGTKIADFEIDGDPGELYAPSGGGSVEDVEVNGASVVNQQGVAEITSYKEVTQAEYDALPASKLADGVMYCIKDAHGADGYPPLIYSDEERKIGVWRDGKPLYQKTFIGTFQTQTIILPVNNTFLIKAWEVSVCDSNGKDSINCGYGNVSSEYVQAYYTANGELVIQNSFYQSRTNYIATIRYTKTTDTAGSGTWTTQGAYAQHYSTSEKVVGTWTDGKPVYEISLSMDNPAYNWTKNNHNIQNIKNIIASEISVMHGIHSFTPYFHSTSDFVGVIINEEGFYISSSGQSIDAISITLRYTKTTD